MERTIRGYRFDDERPIAVGVSSVTYRAVREGAASVSIPVTIKVIDLSAALEDSGAHPNVDLLDSAPLRHVSIVDIRDVIRMGSGRVGIVRELVEGPSVAQVLDALDQSPMPPEVALYIGKQSAGALAYAHNRKILHSDFCHRHVLLSKDGQVKVSDFQVSSLLSRSARAESALKVGKRFFVAPELIDRPDQPISAAADVFSLGVLLYRMATGLFPFADVEVLLEGLQPDLDFTDEEWGPPLSALLARMLSPDPLNRPSADEAWRGIRRILGPGWPGYGSTELAEFLAWIGDRIKPVVNADVHSQPAATAPVPSRRERSGPLDPLPSRSRDPGADTDARPVGELVAVPTRISRRPSPPPGTAPQKGPRAGVTPAPRRQTPRPDVRADAAPRRASTEDTRSDTPADAPSQELGALAEHLEQLDGRVQDLVARVGYGASSDPVVRELTDRIANLEEANSYLAREVASLHERLDTLTRLLTQAASELERADG